MFKNVIAYFRRRHYKRLFMKAYFGYIKSKDAYLGAFASAAYDVSNIAKHFNDEEYFPQYKIPEYKKK